MRRYYPRDLFLLLLPLLFFACHRSSQRAFTLTPLYTPEAATGFQINGIAGDSSTLITISNPWQGAKGIKQRYFVQRNGEQLPDSLIGKVRVLPSNIHRVVCLSSTYVAMFEALGADSCVVGVQGLQYIHNAYIQKHRDQIADFGMEMDYERLVSLKTDLVMLYGVNEAATTMTDKLDQLHIPYIYMGAYLEQSPVGRAEWLMIPAELMNKRHDGLALVHQIATSYNRMKSSVRADLPRPTVMLNLPWNDTWLLPPQDSYMLHLIYDAGAQPIYTPIAGTAPQAIGMESALSMLAKADYWINTGMITSLDQIPPAIMKFKRHIKAWQSDQVYNNNAQMTAGGGNGFYESGVVQPQLVLRDLIHIFHPELSDNPLIYYRQLH